MIIKQDFINYINNKILREASKIQYNISDNAPNTENALFNSTSLIIWNGASDNTIFQDKSVNWAFRALHDSLHLKTRLGFSPLEEIELGRIQASKYSGILSDLIYAEVSGQAKYYLKHGIFVSNQIEFTYNYLKGQGVI